MYALHVVFPELTRLGRVVLSLDLLIGQWQLKTNDVAGMSVNDFQIRVQTVRKFSHKAVTSSAELLAWKIVRPSHPVIFDLDDQPIASNSVAGDADNASRTCNSKEVSNRSFRPANGRLAADFFLRRYRASDACPPFCDHCR
jgi:hypothetical protein